MEQLKKRDTRYWMLASAPSARPSRTSVPQCLCGQPAAQKYLFGKRSHRLPVFIGFYENTPPQTNPKPPNQDLQKGQNDPPKRLANPTLERFNPSTLNRSNPSTLEPLNAPTFPPRPRDNPVTARAGKLRRAIIWHYVQQASRFGKVRAWQKTGEQCPKTRSSKRRIPAITIMYWKKWMGPGLQGMGGVQTTLIYNR